MESTLFTELSEEQQQLVTGGGPTLGIVADRSFYKTTRLLNASAAKSDSLATPRGAASNGAAAGTEDDLLIRSFADQIAIGASGFRDPSSLAETASYF